MQERIQRWLQLPEKQRNFLDKTKKDLRLNDWNEALDRAQAFILIAV